MVEGHRVWRQAIAGLAVLAAAGGVVACGSDDNSDQAAASPDTTTQAAAAPATTAATTPAPAPAETTAEPAPVKTAPWQKEQARVSKIENGPNGPWSRGTNRLAVVRVGTPGIVSVSPKGERVGKEDRWYPKNTKVTIRVKNKKGAYFYSWAGDCVGTEMSCKLKMDNRWKRAIYGFTLKAERKY